MVDKENLSFVGNVAVTTTNLKDSCLKDSILLSIATLDVGDNNGLLCILSKWDTSDTNEQGVFATMTTNEQSSFWESIHGQIKFLLGELTDPKDPENALDSSCTSTYLRDGTMASTSTSSCPKYNTPLRSTELNIRVLRGIVQLANVYMTDHGDSILPDSFFQCTLSFHDILLHPFLHSTGGDGLALSDEISKLCERWWIEKRSGANYLITQLLPALIVRSLDISVKRGDIKRVYAIRESLLLLDFEDESIWSLKDLLLRCFFHPFYLKYSEGHQFLCFLFSLNLDFINDIHATIQNQIPSQRKAVLAIYAQIYFKAWISSSEEFRTKIEYDCIQKFIHSGVHAAHSSMFNAIRIVLSEFFANKGQRGVDEMLLRLHEPIIWRALKAANSCIRQQATMLLTDAYPLQDPDANVQDSDVLLQRQFDAFDALLQDSDPQVRGNAIQGVKKILCTFWEVTPSSTIKTFLSRLVGELVYDSSSSVVRIQVFHCLEALLDNHLSHVFLKHLLPSLSNFINDTTASVKIAFVKLLCRVKNVRNIHFYDIVAIDTLLNRFVMDANNKQIVSLLTSLFIKSYFPQSATATSQVKRCLAFLERNAAAAYVFYGAVYEHVGFGSVCKLILLLLEYWKKSNDLPGESNQVLRMIEALAKSISSDMSNRKNKASVDFLLGEINDDLLFQSLENNKENPQARCCLWRISCSLRKENKDLWMERMICALLSMKHSSNMEEIYAIVHCLGEMNQEHVICQKLSECFHDLLVSPATTIPPSKRKRPQLSIDPTVALKACSYLFSCMPTTREHLLSQRKSVYGLLVELRNIPTFLNEALATPDCVLSDSFLKSLLEQYCLVVIHYHAEKTDDDTQQIVAPQELSHLLEWCVEKVVPFIKNVSEQANLPIRRRQRVSYEKSASDKLPELSLSETLVFIALDCVLDCFAIGFDCSTLLQSIFSLLEALNTMIHPMTTIMGSSLLFQNILAQFCCRLLYQLVMSDAIHDQVIKSDSVIRITKIILSMQSTSLHFTSRLETCITMLLNHPDTQYCQNLLFESFAKHICEFPADKDSFASNELANPMMVLLQQVVRSTSSIQMLSSELLKKIEDPVNHKRVIGGLRIILRGCTSNMKEMLQEHIQTTIQKTCSNQHANHLLETVKEAISSA